MVGIGTCYLRMDNCYAYDYEAYVVYGWVDEDKIAAEYIGDLTNEYTAAVLNEFGVANGCFVVGCIVDHTRQNYDEQQVGCLMLLNKML